MLGGLPDSRGTILEELLKRVRSSVNPGVSLQGAVDFRDERAAFACCRARFAAMSKHVDGGAGLEHDGANYEGVHYDACWSRNWR